jgi:hypothetical protein
MPSPRLSETWESGPAEMAAALKALADSDLVSLPLLDRRSRRNLLLAARGLTWRAARPEVGEGERRVRQDFDLSMTFPPESPYRAFAATLTDLTNQALGRLGAPLLPWPIHFNDLIVQRYAPGSFGITPHRDHIRYVGLVALIVLAGSGSFFACTDRQGTDAHEIDARPGRLILMRAPPFAGKTDRPFHFLGRVGAKRYSLGLRYLPATAGG